MAVVDVQVLDVVGLEGRAILRHMTGREEVSRAFRFELDLLAEALDIDRARGSEAHVALRDEYGHVRHVWGVVEQASVFAGESEELTRYRLHLVPRPYLLALRHGFRIFQDMAVPEIARRVFEDAGLPPGLFDWTAARGRYRTREYTVQYDESEWDFVCRLLEEEGIFFSFRHDEAGHVMVLAEDSTTAAALEPSELAYVEARGLRGADVQVWDWQDGAAAAVSKVTLHDYNMQKPKLPMLCTKEHPEPIALECYEPAAHYELPAEGARLAEARLEEQRAARHTASALTSALYVQPGRLFSLVNHPTTRGEFFVVAAGLEFRRDAEGRGAAHVAVRALPKAARFRPARSTPRPRIVGLQTARVTGPAGKEIHCDELGRIKVQFHWDRLGELDDKSSCWIRVVQPHTTGAILIPRVGWEVIVEFLEGDPDRPVCFGRLYNPMHRSPYSLPGEKTVTGHKSNSSPGAKGVNEVRMDDAAGRQLVAIGGHADICIQAANNKVEKVGNNAGRTVGAARSAHVGGSETIAVKGARNELVVGSHTQAIGASRSITVSGTSAEEIAGGQTLTVGGGESLHVGSPASAVLQIIASAAVSAAAGAAANAASGAQARALGPLAPVLGAASGHVGSASRFLGAAKSLLGGGGAAPQGGAKPAGVAASSSSGGRGPAGVAAQAVTGDAGAMAAGAVASTLSGALAKAGVGPIGAAGSGVWSTTIGGPVSETVGALAAINSGYGVTFSVGGASTELVGAARIELVGGGKVESTGATKLETVGAYLVDASGGISVTSGAAVAVNVAASMRQSIGKGHGISATGAANVSVSKLNLKASGEVSFTCGQASIVVNASGVMIKGQKITLKAPTIHVKTPNIGVF